MWSTGALAGRLLHREVMKLVLELLKRPEVMASGEHEGVEAYTDHHTFHKYQASTFKQHDNTMY